MSESEYTELENTTIKLAPKHKEIADKHGLNLSLFVRNQLEGLEG